MLLFHNLIPISAMQPWFTDAQTTRASQKFSQKARATLLKFVNIIQTKVNAGKQTTT
jgi:hypothetical protein